jgi:preprotein translocase subunit SecY
LRRGGLIIFFAFFYTAIVFNPADTADNLKRHGGFIPGIRPDQRTAEYIDFVLTRITTVGAIYLAVVCLVPEFVISATGIPFYLGGTSLLIVVSVTLDTVSQVQGHLLAHQYDGLVKKAKLRGRTQAMNRLINRPSSRLEWADLTDSLGECSKIWLGRPDSILNFVDPQ